MVKTFIVNETSLQETPTKDYYEFLATYETRWNNFHNSRNTLGSSFYPYLSKNYLLKHYTSSSYHFKAQNVNTSITPWFICTILQAIK